MNYQIMPNDKWTCLTINDPDFLSGKSIMNVIQLILNSSNVKYVVFSNLSIGGYTQKVGAAEEIKSEQTRIKNTNYFPLLDDKPSLEKFIEAYTYLEENQNQILEIKKIFSFIYQIQQFDWGDFFLFINYPLNWDDSAQEYPNMISQTNITIRAVDDQYIDVYCPNVEIVELIKKNYTLSQIETGLLTDFKYPY